MAQAGFTPISLYFSSTASAVPSSGNLANGELGLNIADMKLYAKNSAGTVTLLASNAGASGSVTSVAVSGGTTGLTTSGGPITTSGTITLAGTLATTNGGTGLTSFTSGGVVYASSSSALATGSALTFDGNLLSNLGSADRARFGTPTRSIYIAGDSTGVSLFDGAAQTGNGWYINSASSYIAGYIGSAEQMRLTSTGLGIGTNSPAYKLSVVKPSAGITARFTDGDGITDIYGYGLEITRSVAYIKGSSALHLGSAAGYSALVLDASGNVGIGTSSPAYTVDIRTAASNSLRVGSSANSFGSLLEWNNASGFGRVGTLGGYPFDLATNGSTRFRVGDVGQFGIGGATYGTAGQVLTSGGASAAPTWAAAGGGSQAFVAFGSTGGL